MIDPESEDRVTIQTEDGVVVEIHIENIERIEEGHANYKTVKSEKEKTWWDIDWRWRCFDSPWFSFSGWSLSFEAVGLTSPIRYSSQERSLAHQGCTFT